MRPAPAPPRFTVIPLPFAFSPRAINNKGQIAGTGSPTRSEAEACLWDNGKLIYLGNLAGKPLGPGTTGIGGLAQGINDRGQIVGYSTNAKGFYAAFVWEHGKIRALPGLNNADSSSEAKAINNQGDIVGEIGGRPVLWRGGKTARELNVKRSDTPAAINNAGQIVGSRRIVATGGKSQAYLWERESVRDLGTLPGSQDSYAEDINDKGEIVGKSSPGNAFLWRNGRMMDLGALPGSGDEGSWAHAINNQGQIIGDEFFWQNGKKYWLDRLVERRFAGKLGQAMDINDRGEIVCQRGYLLTPAK